MYLLRERRELDGALVVDMTQLTPAAIALSTATPTSRRIFDPISKQLGPVIHKVFTTGRAEDLQTLLQCGQLDLSYTNESLEGRTALMAAAMHGSRALVSTLLDRGADVLQRDGAGRSALDYAERRPQAEALAVLPLLQLAVARRLQADPIASASEEEQFVYDLYLRTEEAGGGEMEGPCVHVPGLTVASTGDCELVFEWAEDWSDLGDDEDPDSNDERHAGNDYPDEVSSASSEESVEDEELPRFERRGVGRVFVPFTRGEDALLPVPRRPGALQRLWGEEGEESDEEAGEGTQAARLRHMRGASGMRFGASAAEFADDGLAKYGRELSDDEADERLMRDAFGGGRPDRDAVAYDSELDDDDYDEYDDED